MTGPSAAFLTETVDHYRATLTTQDAEGGSVVSYTLLAAAIPCSIQTRSVSREVGSDGQPSRVTQFSIFYTSDPGLSLDDRIVWGTRTLMAVGLLDGFEAHATERA